MLAVTDVTGKGEFVQKRRSQHNVNIIITIMTSPKEQQLASIIRILDNKEEFVCLSKEFRGILHHLFNMAERVGYARLGHCIRWELIAKSVSCIIVTIQENVLISCPFVRIPKQRHVEEVLIRLCEVTPYVCIYVTSCVSNTRVFYYLC